MLALALAPISAPHRHRHRHRHRHACISSPSSSSSSSASSSSSSAAATTFFPVAASSPSFSSPSQWKTFTRTPTRTRILTVKKIPLSFPSRADRACSSSSRISRARMHISCKVQTINQETFSQDVLASDLPVLVGFCADWCGPCKLIGPILDSVSEQFDGTMKTLKIDTDASPDLVTEYDVYGLPTLILFKDGKEVPNSRREGTINAKKLKELLDELLATTSNS